MENIQLEERLKRLNNYISSKALQGYVVIDKNERELTAVLKKEAAKFNHTLHVILTLCTCVWGIVYAIMYMTRGKTSTIRVSIDTSGNLVEEERIG